jgi:hypothetical protein
VSLDQDVAGYGVFRASCRERKDATGALDGATLHLPDCSVICRLCPIWIRDNLRQACTVGPRRRPVVGACFGRTLVAERECRPVGHAIPAPAVGHERLWPGGTPAVAVTDGPPTGVVWAGAVAGVVGCPTCTANFDVLACLGHVHSRFWEPYYVRHATCTGIYSASLSLWTPAPCGAI